MHDVYLSLGSNIDDREKNIINAIKLLGKILTIKKVSSIYETEPVGFKEQEYFYNLVLKVFTDLTPFELLQSIEQIENKLGKKIKRRWGPRSIDIDILYYGNEIIESEELIIPHSLINERRFVLIPMSEIAEEFVCPRTNLKISEILKNYKKEESVIKIKNNTFFQR